MSECAPGGAGSLSFRPATQCLGGDIPFDVVAVELDGDGVLDLAVADLYSDQISVFKGVGDGTFLPFRGGIRREELDPTDYDTPFDLVRETLERA